MDTSTTFGETESIKAKGNADTEDRELSLEDLRSRVRSKYDSQADFARKMQWRPPTASRLLGGTWIPKESRVIRRIAEELDINIVLLTQLFQRLAPNPVLITADRLEIYK